MRFENGYIKLYRRTVTEDIGRNATVLAIWITLLCWANRFASKTYLDGEQCEVVPGGVVTGVRELASHLKLAKSSVDRALHYLSRTGRIERRTGTQGTIVTICNWAEYQSADDTSGTRPGQDRDNSRTTAEREPDPIKDLRLENKNQRFRTQYPQEFESIYGEYVRREGKAAGFKVYERSVKTPEDRERLQRAVRNYTEQCRRESRELKYVKQFGTFMGCWQDYENAPMTSGSAAGDLPLSKVKPV